MGKEQTWRNQTHNQELEKVRDLQAQWAGSLREMSSDKNALLATGRKAKAVGHDHLVSGDLGITSITSRTRVGSLFFSFEWCDVACHCTSEGIRRREERGVYAK